MTDKTERNLENELYLVDRRWICDGAHERWVCKRTGVALTFTVVGTWDLERFKNLVFLLERGFGPGQGGVMRRGKVMIHVKKLYMPHDEFKSMVRHKQIEEFREANS